MKLMLFPHYDKFRRRTIDLAGIEPGHTVLDFGCGVGGLTEYVAERLSNRGTVVGVDIGHCQLETARDRLSSHKNVSFVRTSESGQLPFASNSFDRIVSNLVFHLLDEKQKRTVLSEFRRILKPGGVVVLAESGKPYNLHGKWVWFQTKHVYMRIWEYERNARDSFEGRLPKFVNAVGFDEVKIADRMRGHIDFYRCTKS
ncbi:class I SAM-dependent methyltransferase [Myxococcota bacterium]